MTWTIQSGGEEQNPEGYDGRVWRWKLIADHSADERRFVLVQISGTVMAMGEEMLSARIARARETQGESEVGMVLNWLEPPKEISVAANGVHTTGGEESLPRPGNR